MLDHAVEQLEHHVVLGLHLGAADDGPVARHEPRVLVAELEQLRQRIDAAAEPAAAEPVEHGVALRRDGVADGDDVRVAEST